MGLFYMHDQTVEPVQATSFQASDVLEKHLQQAIMQEPSLLGEDLLVVSKEFGHFSGANRKIDLLCLDRSGRLVVVELKRTRDGGHMELQSLRYAAMVSIMTMVELRDTFERHLVATKSEGDPDSILHDWLADAEDDDIPSRDVRIILVSEGFDQEITTTVLWLNDLFGLDIRCIRLTPYKVGDQLVLDAQQLIPLPEAAKMTVQLRRKEQETRARSGSRDFTKYSIVSPAGETEPLAKLQAGRAMVEALHEAGTTPEKISEALPNTMFLNVSGTLTGPDLESAFIEQWPLAEGNLQRWFIESPIHGGGNTWVLSKNNWGARTETLLNALQDIAPSGDFGYRRH